MKDEDLIDVNDTKTHAAMGEGALKIVDHFKGLEEAAQDYERPTPEWCAELYDVQAQIEALQLREKKLKDVAKKWKDRGSFVHGGYCLKISERAGSRTLDKEALFQRLTAELGEAEAQTYMNEATKVGKPSVVISIEKISQGDTGPGERSGT